MLKKLLNRNKKVSQTESNTHSFEERMQYLERYFKYQMADNSLFEPEYSAVKEINKYILKEDFSKEDLFKIVEIYNNTCTMQHYNGTGWLDLSMHIQGVVKSFGLKYRTTELNQIRLEQP